jgi:uncharacterized protein (TIGR03437 family)
VPVDNARHVPDVALNADPDHNRGGYLIYGDGDKLGTPSVIGGTSAPTPAFAGVVALLNQYVISTGAQTTAGLGNINPQLYSLAQTSPAIFHDITTGDNIVAPPGAATPVGYSAGPGYDQVTGLGSMDVWKLMSCWRGACLSLSSNLSSIGATDTAFLTATVTAASGVTPVGEVQFSANGTALGPATLIGSAGTASATLAITGSQLPAGTSTVTASYHGGSSATSITSSLIMSVRTAGSSSNGTPAVAGLTDGASFQQRYSPGMIMSVFGSALSPSVASAGAVPLPVTLSGVEATINDEAAPLYYVSPTQLNIQIPYETPANSTATLKINNNGIVTSQNFTLGGVTPGIFTDQNRTIVPTTSASANQVATMFLTGVGAVTPAVATGAAPAATAALSSLPTPGAVIVTVGGKAASTACEFCFVGIPSGLVGVVQINFQVPSGLAPGPQPVIVTVGGISSTAASINITN